MAESHVSRWRLPVAPSSARSAAVASTDAYANAQAHTGAVSLRYLDEFVRKLQCAPRLLEHQLFPDAKEITESMGLFNAVRRYVISNDSDSTHRPHQQSPLADGIVVVGDGNTPRSAAMFAYRLKHWKCYAIDPAMERPDLSSSSSSTRANGWSSIDNLVVVRNKIENVHITLRRAVVVLVHAHVTLEQALSAVVCEELVGVVTMPCCNWYGQQEALFDKPPSIVYDDFSILSDHRELRVWVGPRPDGGGGGVAELALDQSEVMAKGCVRKEFQADFGVPKTGDGVVVDGTKILKKKNETVHATTLFQELLAYTADEDSVPAPTRPSAYATIASPAQCETVAAHVEASLGDKSARVLVLIGDGPPRQSAFVCTLLQQGFSNVFGLQSPAVKESETENEAKDRDTLQLQVVKLGVLPDGSAASAIQCTTTSVPVIGSDGSQSYETSIIKATTNVHPFELFDCVIDVGFIHRCLRNQPKKSCGPAFQRLIQLALSWASPTKPAADVRVITVVPRKDWRKSEFLANERLGLTFATIVVAADIAGSSAPLYLYACQSAADTRQTGDGVVGKNATQMQKKQLALQLKQALENDFASHAVYAQLPLSSLAEAKAVADLPAPSPHRVRVQGIVQHLRRFTTGPSFFSIAPPSGEAASFRGHLQVSMDPQRLTHWCQDISLDAVFRLLHKSDAVECVGEMTRNAQQQPMLQLDALQFVESEFQAYQ